MKATGIVRRIDDLGRVVVPKEIRRTLRIREGDPLEIYTDREGEIILKKYSPIGELSQFAAQYAKILSETTGYLVCVSDRDHVICACGSGKKDYEKKAVSRELEAVMEDRKTLLANEKERDFIPITEDDPRRYSSQAIATIISHGDAIGSVIMFGKDRPCRSRKSRWLSRPPGFWEVRWSSRGADEVGRRVCGLQKCRIAGSFFVGSNHWKRDVLMIE